MAVVGAAADVAGMRAVDVVEEDWEEEARDGSPSMEEDIAAAAAAAVVAAVVAMG